MTASIPRRTALLGLIGAAVCGCAGGRSLETTRDPAMRPVPNTGWADWAAAFRVRARARGISDEVLERAFQGAGYVPGVIARDRNQTEFTRTLGDYLAIAASDDRVAKGRAQAARREALLTEIQRAYGVPGKIVAAIWGLESSYGERRGDIPVVSATSTLAYDGRRGAFFEKQLVAALRILEAGDTTPDRLVGSWAGAMGHTQFIPTSYLAFAIDFRGDGRRDIWSDDPTDALASAARYLQRSGWQPGRPWGAEVRVPEGYAGPFGRAVTRSPAAWRAAGIRAADGGALPEIGPAALLAPTGRAGPAFLVTRNFEAILRYNNAESYGIGIGHLSDRIAGAAPLRTRFPPDRFGLTIDDRKAIQRGLARAGFDAGTADGVLGPQTRSAITAYQRDRGLSVTGEPSRALLDALG